MMITNCLDNSQTKSVATLVLCRTVETTEYE